MADRQIVIAAHDTSPEALGAIFPGQQPRTAGAWTWLRLDPWAPGRQQLEAGLDQLQGPVIRLSTEDDCRWYLRLRAGGEQLLAACNHLALLGGEEYEDDAEFDSLGDLLDDYYELVPADCHPPATVDPLRELPPAEGTARYLGLQAEAVADALARAGLPVEADEIVACLTGASVTDGERDWPMGNLPRFADCLGLEAFDGWLQELAEYEALGDEEEDEDAEELDEEQDEEEGDEVLTDAEMVFQVLEAGELMDAAPLLDEAGVSVTLEVTAQQLGAARMAAWFCDNSTDVALRLRLPAGAAPWSELPHGASQLPDGILVDPMEGGLNVRLGLRPTTMEQQRPLLGLLGRVLEVLPDGTRVELFCYSDLDEREAGNQLYSGVVRQGSWSLERTAPSRTRAELAEALALAAQVEATGPVRAADEQEAALVLAVAEQTMDLRLRGAELWGDDDARLHLVRLVFHHRFEPRWRLEEFLPEEDVTEQDLAPAAPDEEEMNMAFIEATQSIGDMFNRMMGKAPEGAEVLHKGEAATFYRVELEEHMASNPLTKFAGLLGDMPAAGEGTDWTVAGVDEGMAGIGFGSLGDLVCDRFMDVPMRGYATPEGDTFGTLVTNPMGETFPEFYSQFEDGASLITSVKVDQPSPERKSYRLHLPGGTVEQLYEKHCQGVALRVEEGGAAATPAEPTLEGLARAIDAFIKRRLQ